MTAPHPLAVEIGATRPLGTVGRDVFTAAQAAYLRGEVTELVMGGQLAAAIVPAGPTSPVVAALNDVNAAQAEVADNWSRSADENELIALRELAIAVRAERVMA